MFRCITEVRGLVFDIDSFNGESVKTIMNTFIDYKILFMTASEEKAKEIEELFGKELVYRMEKFQRIFAPNQHTQTEVLKRLNIKATELLYVSKSMEFLGNAMAFIGGTTCYYEFSFGNILSFQSFAQSNQRGFPENSCR